MSTVTTVIILFVVFSTLSATSTYAWLSAGWLVRSGDHCTAIVYAILGCLSHLALTLCVSGAFSFTR